MAKSNKTSERLANLLSIPISLGNNAFYVERVDNSVDIKVVPILGAMLKDKKRQSRVVEIISLNDKRYDYLAENRGGIKELGQIIIDEREAIDTAIHYAKKDLEKAEEAEKKAKERVSVCTQLVDLFENMETIERPEHVGDTIVVDTFSPDENSDNNY